jgi:hypothetical protein
MAIIIETCPKCGHDLMDVILPTNPPIPKKECCGCGWSWTGTREQVFRVPFGGNAFYPDNKYTLVGSKYDELVNVNCDDASCALNNINGVVYEASKSYLDNVNKLNYDDIAAAIERTKKYIRD